MNKETYTLLFRSWYQQLPLHIRLTSKGLFYAIVAGIIAIVWMIVKGISINLSTYIAMGLLFVIWIKYCQALANSFERDLERWFQSLSQVRDYSKMSK